MLLCEIQEMICLRIRPHARRFYWPDAVTVQARLNRYHIWREAVMDKNIYHVPYVYGKMDGSGTVSVRVPGSKSITNRALLLAMLADGPCTLTGALFSDDSRYLQQCIADLGFGIEADEERAEDRKSVV